MDNNEYLNQIKQYYNSLKYFDIENNYLILNLDKQYIIPLINTKLWEINQDIFLSTPNEIFHFLQMNELLYKNELTNNEINYIRNFSNKYLLLKKNNNEGKYVNNITLWCLELIIGKSFDDEFIDKPASKEILAVINNDNKNLESGLNTGIKLVLSKNGNHNFEMEEEVDNIKNFEKAGFTTIILIALTITLTCIYFASFIIQH